MYTIAFLIGLTAFVYGLSLDLFNVVTLVFKRYSNRSQVVLVPAMLYLFGYLVMRLGAGTKYGIAAACAIFFHIGLVVLIPLVITRRSE